MVSCPCDPKGGETETWIFQIYLSSSLTCLLVRDFFQNKSGQCLRNYTCVLPSAHIMSAYASYTHLHITTQVHSHTDTYMNTYNVTTIMNISPSCFLADRIYGYTLVDSNSTFCSMLQLICRSGLWSSVGIWWPRLGDLPPRCWAGRLMETAAGGLIFSLSGFSTMFFECQCNMEINFLWGESFKKT